MTSGVAVRLRDDFGAAELRSLAARSKDGPQARRLLALAAVAEGRPRTEAARVLGVRMLAVKNSRKRRPARSPALAMTAGTVGLVATAEGRRGVLVIALPLASDTERTDQVPGRGSQRETSLRP